MQKGADGVKVFFFNFVFLLYALIVLIVFVSMVFSAFIYCSIFIKVDDHGHKVVENTMMRLWYLLFSNMIFKLSVHLENFLPVNDDYF